MAQPVTATRFPKKLSQMIAWKYREDYRREHGTNPPSSKEDLTSLKAKMESMTPKDIAALGVRIARGSVAVRANYLHPGHPVLLEAEEELKRAEREYADTPGKETPRTMSLREKVCNFLKDNIRMKWRVREIATVLGHPSKHVGVVVSFLLKEGKYPNIIK